jgi:hypothetical protein
MITMIIDIHCHLGQPEMFPKKYLEAFANHISKMLSGVSKKEVYDSEIMKKSFDGAPERLINEMDQAGIDKTVVFGVDWGLALGEPEVKINDYNKYIVKSCEKYPDRLIPFFTIDPRREKASQLLETAIKDWGMKGLKLHPSTGYDINGPKALEIFNKALELNIPIISHLGYLIGLKGRSAKPEFFDDISTDFPNLKISLAHLNYGSVDDLLSLMFSKTNIYCDFCAHGQILMMNSPPDLYKQLRYFMNFEGVKDRVMFGSDWPMTSNIMSLKDWVSTIRNLRSEKVSALLDNLGYKKFKNSEIKKLLGKNAEGFLNGIL